jgi:hypothetical protein
MKTRAPYLLLPQRAMRPKIFYLLTILGLGLQGCVSTAPQQRSFDVVPGQAFPGSYINVTSPTSAGWKLLQSSGGGMSFARRGQAANESFGAQVQMFNLAPTNTPEEFEALIRTAAQKDTDPTRFNARQTSFTYSNERSYPCVRYHSVVEDTAPQGIKGTLLLETEGLYCRHPLRQHTGFAVIYSHRGENLHSSLRSEAESFINGTQVPEMPNPAAQGTLRDKAVQRP